MSDAALRHNGLPAHPIPVPREGPRRLPGLDRFILAAIARLSGVQAKRAGASLLAAAQKVPPAPTDMSDTQLRTNARQAAQRGDRRCALGFVAEAARRSLGLSPRNVQLAGALGLCDARLIEMQTGEGKTLTAGLAATVIALQKQPVHVVTANGYLAARDADFLRPLFEVFGLRVGVVTADTDLDERRDAYRCHITYATSNELAFDHLKDRLSKRLSSGSLVDRVGAAFRPLDQAALQPALPFALIDEADSILIDEARTPLILSGEGPALFDPTLIHDCAGLVQTLQKGRDFVLLGSERRADLTSAGRARLARHTSGHAHLRNRILREDLARMALTAQHLLNRDDAYFVRDGAIVIIDENTGRAMPDRFWTDGLQQFVEFKEGLALSKGRRTLARTTFQTFFRKYDALAGMTGTAREASHEIARDYGMWLSIVPPHQPSRRTDAATRVFARADQKWQVLAKDVAALHAINVPVLIGVQSLAASKAAEQALHAVGLKAVMLSAEQDADEASKISRAGQAGAIIIATNMAGRGADIPLGPGVAALGGLHVFRTCLHESRRIDRQLAGRAGRQGDPGRIFTYVSLGDAGVELHPTLVQTLTLCRVPQTVARAVLRHAQNRLERQHAAMRYNLIKQDETLEDALSYAQKP